MTYPRSSLDSSSGGVFATQHRSNSNARERPGRAVRRSWPPVPPVTTDTSRYTAKRRSPVRLTNGTHTSRIDLTFAIQMTDPPSSAISYDNPPSRMTCDSGGCRFRASVADTGSPSWRDAELPSKWRLRFSCFRGGS
jgi:hypothetical protein